MVLSRFPQFLFESGTVGLTVLILQFHANDVLALLRVPVFITDRMQMNRCFSVILTIGITLIRSTKTLNLSQQPASLTILH